MLSSEKSEFLMHSNPFESDKQISQKQALSEHTDKLVQFFLLLIEIDKKSKRKGKENESKNI